MYISKRTGSIIRKENKLTLGNGRPKFDFRDDYSSDEEDNAAQGKRCRLC